MAMIGETDAGITLGIHDATAYAHSVNGAQVWIAWLRVGDRIVDTEECGSDVDAMAWCTVQAVRRNVVPKWRKEVAE